MSISTDPQVLQQLVAIIDFIQNVATYKDVVATLQDATVKYQTAFDSLRQGQSLTDWSAQLDAKAAKIASDTKDAEDSLAIRIAAKEQALADQATDLANRQTALIQAEKDFADRATRLVANEARAAQTMANADGINVAIAAAQADIKQRELALQDKAAKLQSLLG